MNVDQLVDTKKTPLMDYLNQSGAKGKTMGEQYAQKLAQVKEYEHHFQGMKFTQEKGKTLKFNLPPWESTKPYPKSKFYISGPSNILYLNLDRSFFVEQNNSGLPPLSTILKQVCEPTFKGAIGESSPFPPQPDHIKIRKFLKITYANGYWIYEEVQN